MEQIQMAKLTLKTSTMAPDSFSQYGTVDQYRTNITWNNINMRLLLGDMYDRYDLFNLQLVNIGCNDDITYVIDDTVTPPVVTNVPLTKGGATAGDRNVNLNMTGLNFINSTYDSFRNTNSNKIVLSTYQFYNTYSRDYNNAIVTFGKGNDVCNLNIYYTKIETDQIPTTVNEYPNVTFIFNIYGIPREVKKLPHLQETKY